jgi:predicted phosphoribosyltransferase
MKDHAILQRDVLAALPWEPSLDAAEIGAMARDGVPAGYTGTAPTPSEPPPPHPESESATMPTPAVFWDRTEAGRLLAEQLTAYTGRTDVVVLALPRGGVPVAYQVARALGAPLDVLVVRRLGVPGHEELAMGAIASGGLAVLDDDVVEEQRISRRVIESVVAQELCELGRRERAYRNDRPAPEVRGRTVILVDDGLATRAMRRAAVVALHRLGAAGIVVAVPTAPPATWEEFCQVVDEAACAITREPCYVIGGWDEDDSQTTDDEVRVLLERAELQSS